MDNWYENLTEKELEIVDFCNYVDEAISCLDRLDLNKFDEVERKKIIDARGVLRDLYLNLFDGEKYSFLD